MLSLLRKFKSLWININYSKKFNIKIHHSVIWQNCKEFFSGAGSIISKGCIFNLDPRGQLILGEYCWVGPDAQFSTRSKISIGNSTSIQSRTQIYGEVSIGSGCLCASDLYISSAKHHFDLHPCLPILLQDEIAANLSPDGENKAVIIDDDCWIGIRVAVMPGIRVGKGSIIGANSVIVNDIAPYSIVAGVPGRVIGRRINFSPPDQLNSENDFDLPYFYSGFMQISLNKKDNKLSRTRGGLLVVGNYFQIALNADPGDVIEIELVTPFDGEIRHCGQVAKVAPHSQKIRFNATPDSVGLLNFEWLQVKKIKQEKLIIKKIINIA